MKFFNPAAYKLLILLSGALPVALCSPTHASENRDFGSLEMITDKVSFPANLIFPHDGSGRMFVLEHHQGKILVVQNGELLPQPFLDISDRMKALAHSEEGLAGLAFPPGFPEKKYVYVTYTDKDQRQILSRFRLSEDTTQALENSEEKILTIKKFTWQHNCAHIAFSPKDHYLYYCIGDSDDPMNPRDTSQNKNTLLGKILRLDVESPEKPYRIPPDNPLVGKKAARPEIWAYGLRNSWRFSFDPLTGDLLIPDTSFKEWEEINFQPASSRGGENYGWVRAVGNECLSECSTLNLTWPIYEYLNRSIGCAVVGGTVYRGRRHPQWQGVYFFSDFCSGEVWALRNYKGKPEIRTLVKNIMKVTVVETGPDGEIYVAEMQDGTIFRLRLPENFDSGWESVIELHAKRMTAAMRDETSHLKLHSLRKKMNRVEKSRRWRWTQPLADFSSSAREKFRIFREYLTGEPENDGSEK